jgi:hypothetical protein
MRAQATNSSHKTNHQKRKKTNMKAKHSGNSGKIEALKNAIVAAINATGDSSTALTTVRKAFTRTIHGVKVLAKEPEPAWLSNN